MQFLKKHPFFIRLFHWEFWSFAAVYTWIYPVWFFYCLKARSFFFFAAANPRIRNGGFLNESKKELAPQIPARYHPPSVFFGIPENGDHVLSVLRESGLDYPLIGKPDIGGRGRGVKVLADDSAVRQYVSTVSMDFHIQEFVPYPLEAGIFYCRIPGTDKGRITGIVYKEFLKVKGDGKQSISELLLNSPRAIMYYPALVRMLGAQLHQVLPEGELFTVSPYGNHARGSLFLDYSDRADAELTATMDRICQEIPEFYYGRLDIRFDNWEDLKQGKNMAIIEVNGAGAEPTHIYDPRHSLFFAWKEIIRHWKLLYQVSLVNHQRGIPYLTFQEGLAMFREDKEWSRRLAAIPE